MTPQFQNELAKIAKECRELILQDDFTKGIKPDFLKVNVLDYPLRNGKCLRPALLIWCCGLFGGNTDDAKFAAAAVEIFHNWTLVHDDIIDDDNIRRGQPSTHCRIARFAKSKYRLTALDAQIFGKNNAILVGDIQHAWAINMLSKTPVERNIIVQLISDFCSMCGRDLICGEALDVEISYKKWDKITNSLLLKIAELKTARLLQFSAICGAKIAIANRKIKSKQDFQNQLKTISDFAKFAGLAFQIKDDLIGVFADEEKSGKPVLSDLSENKASSVILETFKRAGKKDKSFLLSLAGRKKFSQREINQVQSIVSACGAENACKSKAERFKEAALGKLMQFRNCEFRRLLEEWTFFILERKK